MTALLLFLTVLALLVYGLERNHARRPYPRSRLAGSSDVDDRDAARINADLVRRSPRLPGRQGMGRGRAKHRQGHRHVISLRS
jgi:hypothetical protein